MSISRILIIKFSVLFSVIRNNEIKILDVVEAMETSLTHKKPEERSAGTRFLADIIHELPKDHLNSDQLKNMTLFFIDRLKDHHSVVPHVISALLALVSMIILTFKQWLNLLY